MSSSENDSPAEVHADDGMPTFALPIITQDTQDILKLLNDILLYSTTCNGCPWVEGTCWLQKRRLRTSSVLPNLNVSPRSTQRSFGFMPAEGETHPDLHHFWPSYMANIDTLITLATSTTKDTRVDHSIVENKEIKIWHSIFLDKKHNSKNDLEEEFSTKSMPCKSKAAMDALAEIV
ncbi:hypothetical protein BGW80DRAFT_1255933 [Lactifluus volemus]|nr:hypothetical protein BGW80DRAFT_1255933 [Lactifluus volemus]